MPIIKNESRQVFALPGLQHQTLASAPDDLGKSATPGISRISPSTGDLTCGSMVKEPRNYTSLTQIPDGTR